MLELFGCILAFLPETDLRLSTELSDTSLKMCLEAHWVNGQLQLHAAQVGTGVIVRGSNATSGFISFTTNYSPSYIYLYISISMCVCVFKNVCLSNVAKRL